MSKAKQIASPVDTPSPSTPPAKRRALTTSAATPSSKTPSKRQRLWQYQWAPVWSMKNPDMNQGIGLHGVYGTKNDANGCHARLRDSPRIPKFAPQGEPGCIA